MREFKTIAWTGRALRIIDQTLLPGETRYLDLESAGEVREAIRTLKVRGAPAIGVAAAFGLYLGIRDAAAEGPELLEVLEETRALLETSRPTAVNLFSTLKRVAQKCRDAATLSGAEIRQAALREAQLLETEDRLACAEISRCGADLIPARATILTHCNAGALATAGSGTALGVIFQACRLGKKILVYADETRPLLQGSRLTAWELAGRAIETVLICDSAAAWVMKTRGVDLVLTGADRIAANGDTANKIGTYALAILAKRHRVPFYVAAPVSTFDLSLAEGGMIPIEERAAEEVTVIAGRAMAPPGVAAFNPAFDVTPGQLVSGFITDRGVIRPPFGPVKFRAAFADDAPRLQKQA